jgi:hypothetical protein
MAEQTIEDRMTALESAVEALGNLVVTGGAGATERYLAWHNRNAPVVPPVAPPAATSAPPPAGP